MLPLGESYIRGGVIPRGLQEVDTAPNGVFICQQSHDNVDVDGRLQQTFDVLTDLFDYVVLWTNIRKMVKWIFNHATPREACC